MPDNIEDVRKIKDDKILKMIHDYIMLQFDAIDCDTMDLEYAMYRGDLEEAQRLKAKVDESLNAAWQVFNLQFDQTFVICANP